MILEDLLRNFYRNDVRNVENISSPLIVKGYFKNMKNGIPFPSANTDERFLEITGGIPKKMKDGRSVSGYGLSIEILGKEFKLDDLYKIDNPEIYYGNVFDSVQALAGILGKDGIRGFFRLKSEPEAEELRKRIKAQQEGKDYYSKEFNEMVNSAELYSQSKLFSNERAVEQVGLYHSKAGNVVVKSFSENKDYEATLVQMLEEPKFNDKLSIHSGIFRSGCECERSKKFYRVTNESKEGFIGFCKHMHIVLFGFRNGEKPWTKDYSKVNVFEGLRLKDTSKQPVSDLNHMVPYSPLMADNGIAKEIGSYALFMRYADASNTTSKYYRVRDIDRFILEQWETVTDPYLLSLMVKNMADEKLRKECVMKDFDVMPNDILVAPPAAIIPVLYNKEERKALLRYKPMRGPK